MDDNQEAALGKDGVDLEIKKEVDEILIEEMYKKKRE